MQCPDCSKLRHEGECKTGNGLAVVSLCDRSGVFARPWAEAGYECWCIDIQHSIRRPRREIVGDGEINYIWGDVRAVKRPTKKRIVFGAAFTPCTHVAGSGARDFATKGGYLMRDALEMFEAARQVLSWLDIPYMMENSTGVFSSVPHIGKPDYYFDPHQYAGYADSPDEEAYTKRTCIWAGGGFVMPPVMPVDPILGSKMHLMSPSDERADERSKFPQGFSRAVYLSNSALALQRAAA